MPLNPRQLDAFRMVMLRGSATAAAVQLGISQPAVSRLIRDLEIRSGLALFERQGNHLVPTPEASLLLAEVERYAIGLTALETFARELAEKKRGALRLVALPAMAMGFLPRFVARFVEGRDLSRVFVHGMPSHLVIEAIAAGQADIGFAAGPAERPGLAIEPISAAVVVALPRAHRLADRRVIRASDLKGERLVALSEPTIFAGAVPAALERLLRGATIVTPLTGIACHLVRAGAGIALVDPFAAIGLDSVELAVVPFEPAIPVRMAVVTAASRPLSRLSSEFLSDFKRYIADEINARDPRQQTR